MKHALLSAVLTVLGIFLYLNSSPLASAQTRLTPNPATLDFEFEYSTGFGNAGASYSPANAQMTFTVAGASVPYQASATPESGSYKGWIIVTPSGITGQAITINVIPTNLPPGKYLALVAVTFGGTYPRVTIPVTVNIAEASPAHDNLTVNGFGFTSQQSFASPRVKSRRIAKSAPAQPLARPASTT